MSDQPPLPSFPDEHVLDCLRRAAGRGLTHTQQAEGDVMEWDYDLKGVEELIAECEHEELWAHEPSDHYPEFYDYIVVLKVHLEGERRPFYVKVALALPNLDTGELMSFHPWGMTRQ